jgi:curli biogenesis system outer membrane secretion channel CsgG
MIRAVRCTTALLVVLAASACGTSPTAPVPVRRAPDAQALRAVPDSAVPSAKTSLDCDPETGNGCCYDSQPWWC